MDLLSTGMEHIMGIAMNEVRFPGGSKLAISELGLGTAALGNLYRSISEGQAQDTLEAAWDLGVRYFDTAPLYGLGLAETRLNQFLRGRPRDSYVLSSKIGRLLKVCAPEQRTGIGKFFDTPSRQEVFDYSYDGVMRSVEASLERLGVDRIDMLFAHDLDVFTHQSQAQRDHYIDLFLRGGYRALHQLREEKVVHAIGAGVNEWQACEILAKAGDFDVFLLAGRYTLLEQTALDSFLPLCEQRGIKIVIGGAYNSGILASGPVPGAYYNYEPAPADIMSRVAAIQALCQSHGVALIEAALRFPLMHPAVVSVIPGAASPQEIQSSVQILQRSIPDALWQSLQSAGLLRSDAPLTGMAQGD